MTTWTDQVRIPPEKILFYSSTPSAKVLLSDITSSSLITIYSPFKSGIRQSTYTNSANIYGNTTLINQKDTSYNFVQIIIL